MKKLIILAVVFSVSSFSIPCLAACPTADLNGDCQVDFADLAILASQWLSGAASVDVLNYSLRDDFSTTQNPNGVWSYNLSGSPITGTVPQSSSPLDYGSGWGYRSDYAGSIIKTSGSCPENGANDWQVGDIMVHPYSLSGDDSIKWTSPSAGTIAISGQAWDGFFYSGRDASWRLAVNGTVVAGRSTIYGIMRTDAVASFSNNLVPNMTLSGISVAKGDVVEFTNQATVSWGHFMGVNMDIALTTVPESTQCTAPSWCGGADINNDGHVDFEDFAILANHWLDGATP